MTKLVIFYHFLLIIVSYSGLCHISGLEQEKTHRKTIELEDGCGMIDIFITITGTTPTYENINDNDSLASVALDVIPTKINEEDIERYVS